MKRRVYAKPPMRECVECGVRGQRVSDLCRECAGGATVALTDGAWVIDQRRRVLAWQESPQATAEPAPPALASHNTERGYQWHRYWGVDWPLPTHDPCGCRAAHAAHEALRKATGRRASSPARKAS